jgi:hypothetical protein
MRLASDPNAPVLPEHMTLDELRESIMADFERLRDAGVLSLPKQGLRRTGLRQRQMGTAMISMVKGADK